MNLIHQKAIQYVAQGYSIIPLKKDKRPLLGSGENITFQRHRHPTEEELSKWFSKNPANIGICTGKISNITVIDIDLSQEGNKTPLETFPETFTVKTPTGGYHLYYLYDETIGQTANTFPQFPHVDIRNDGGYVVAAPSKCDYMKYKVRIRGEYEVFREHEIAPFPRHLFLSSDPISTRKDLNKLLKGFPKMAEGDGRNNALTSITGKILLLVPPEEHQTIGLSMVRAANDQFKAPLPEKEVLSIFNSIASKEARKPLSSTQFIRTDKGVIIANEENVYRTIKADPILHLNFRFNTFSGLIESRFENTVWQTIQRIDIISLRTYLMRTYAHFVKIPHNTVEDGLMLYVKEHAVSPPVEWMKNIVWDNVPRLDTWISKVYGTPDDEYHKKLGANWLKGLVMRLTSPGSKFDYVMVLEGKQGIRKSTSLMILGSIPDQPSLHVETVFTPDNKDFFMIFSGKAIIEFSEGETLSRTEAKRLKAVITMQSDKYRPPYERSPREFPRQCVFAMTTNQEQYLKDETGNRRWLPVACADTIDIEWLKENRDQLYAEAYHRVVNLKESAHEFPIEETLAQQELRQVADPREAEIFEWYFLHLNSIEREDGITTRMAYQDGVHKGKPFTKEMDKLDEMVIGSILKNKMKLDRKRSMKDGERSYKYYPTAESEAMAPPPKQMHIEEEVESLSFNN